MAKKIKYGKALYIRVTDELKKKIKHEALKKHQGVTDYLRSILTKSVNLESLKNEKKGKVLKIKKHLYNPHLSNPFRLTSSRLELYQSCRQCFYLYLREGIRRPGFLIPTFSQTIDEKVRNVIYGRLYQGVLCMGSAWADRHSIPAGAEQPAHRIRYHYGRRPDRTDSDRCEYPSRCGRARDDHLSMETQWRANPVRRNPQGWREWSGRLGPGLWRRSFG